MGAYMDFAELKNYLELEQKSFTSINNQNIKELELQRKQLQKLTFNFFSSCWFKKQINQLEQQIESIEVMVRWVSFRLRLINQFLKAISFEPVDVMSIYEVLVVLCYTEDFSFEFLAQVFGLFVISLVDKGSKDGRYSIIFANDLIHFYASDGSFLYNENVDKYYHILEMLIYTNIDCSLNPNLKEKLFSFISSLTSVLKESNKKKEENLVGCELVKSEVPYLLDDSMLRFPRNRKKHNEG